MISRFSPVPLLLAVLVAFSFPTVPTAVGEAGDESDDAGSRILLRVLCKEPAPGASSLMIIQNEEALHDLNLTPSFISDPLAIGRGEFILVDPDGGADNAILRSSIPDAGRRFVLALMPSQAPGRPYEHRLVRIDDIDFGISDFLIFNLTATPVGGRLGTSDFRLRAGESTVVTPEPEVSGDRVYQSRFFHQHGDEVRLFNDTRWPVSRTARIYLFFIPDPERQSIGYHTFREYRPFP